VTETNCPLNNLSVVITCYREGELLLDAVKSIRQQTHQPLEIIVVNDASPDDATNNICRQLEGQAGIRIVWQQENGGPAIARDAGFEVAKGEVLVPLDADDLLPPKALQHIQAAFDAHPDAGFIYGSYDRQDSETETQRVLTKPLSLRSMLRARPWSLSTNWTLIGTAPLRKWVWDAVGRSDSTYGRQDLHDLEFWIRAMQLPCAHYPTPETIYIWRKYLGSNSRQVTPMAWHRVAEKHFATYEALGLSYRAYELLLLGSKWAGRGKDSRRYGRKLAQLMLKGDCQFSSWVALLVPAPIFHWLAARAGRRR